MNLTPQAESQINYVCPHCSVHRRKKTNTCIGCGKKIKTWGIEIKPKTFSQHFNRFIGL